MTEKLYAALFLYTYKSPCKTAECSNTGTVWCLMLSYSAGCCAAAFPCVDLSLLLIDDCS